MARFLLSALLALAPALPAAAQVRAAALSAPTVAAAPSAIAPLGASALVPALSASAVSLLPASPSVSAAVLPAVQPAGAIAFFALPAAAASAAPALAPMPAARLDGRGVPASIIASAADPAAPARAPPAGRSAPVALRSLQDLQAHFQSSDASRAAEAAYDGARGGSGRPSAAPVSEKPRVQSGMRGVAVRSLRGGLAEFQAHEVATIKKIQVYAQDLQVLVREAGPTPDLVVNGVVTELKTVHKPGIERQLSHANGQLVSHAKRHSLGPGAVVLDLIGVSMTTREVEAGIARVLRSEPAIGFDRVYVFSGDDLKTYARSPDGSFRHDPAAAPFGPASEPALAAR